MTEYKIALNNGQVYKLKSAYNNVVFLLLDIKSAGHVCIHGKIVLFHAITWIEKC